MSNVAQVLKAEIVRIGRREARAEVAPVRSAGIKLKKSVLELKQKLAALEAQNKRLVAALNARQQQPAPAGESETKARLTSRGVRSLRKKLALTRDQFAKLVGSTGQTVYMWEKKTGVLKLRGTAGASLLAIRDIGKREAKARLAEMAEKSPKAPAAPKKKKRK